MRCTEALPQATVSLRHFTASILDKKGAKDIGCNCFKDTSKCAKPLVLQGNSPLCPLYLVSPIWKNCMVLKSANSTGVNLDQVTEPYPLILVQNLAISQKSDSTYSRPHQQRHLWPIVSTTDPMQLWNLFCFMYNQQNCKQN